MRMFLVVSLLGACGGDSGALDCAYLASEDNCYKQTATMATSCLPPDGAFGVLAPDFGSCTYDTGQVITFNPPLVLPLDNDQTWDFEVVTNGTPCLAYHDDDNGFELTVNDQTVSEQLQGRGLEIECPDGSSFSNSNALELLSCPGDNFGDLPGFTSSSGTDSVFFGLINTGSGETLTVFDCQ
jgi:hypothetical protein